MRVHPNFGDHHGKFGLGVATDHGLSNFGIQVTVPDVGDSVRLGFDGTRKFGHGHVQKNLVYRCHLSKGLLIFIVAVFEDLRH